MAQDGSGWPSKLPGCLKEVNIFDLALGATWGALYLWCLCVSNMSWAVLGHPGDKVHFPDVDGRSSWVRSVEFCAPASWSVRTAKEDTGTGTAGMTDELNSKKDDCECSVTKVTLKNTDLFLGDPRWTTSSSQVLLFLLAADFLGPGFCFTLSGNGYCSFNRLSSSLSSAMFLALFLSYSLCPFNPTSVAWPSPFILSPPATSFSLILAELSVANCPSPSSSLFHSSSSGSAFERLHEAQSSGAVTQCRSSHYLFINISLWYSQNDAWRNLSNGMRYSLYATFPRNLSKVSPSFIFPMWDLYIQWAP